MKNLPSPLKRAKRRQTDVMETHSNCPRVLFRTVLNSYLGRLGWPMPLASISYNQSTNETVAVYEHNQDLYRGLKGSLQDPPNQASDKRK